MAIKIAVLGAGRIGKMHVANLAAHPAYELRSVYDVSAELARASTADYPGVKVAASDNELFADGELDAVLIATPVGTHCDYIVTALERGLAVLCEKPLGSSADEVRACMEVVKKAKLPVQVGFNRRFDPSHSELIARAKADGALEKLIITSRDPDVPSLEYLKASGGLFMDMMIHDFDLALSILPEAPTAIYVAASCLIPPKTCQQANDVDTAMAVLRTDSGVLCHINCSRRSVYGYDQRIEAFGANGMFVSNNPRPNQLRVYDGKATNSEALLYHFFIERYVDSYRLQLDAFAEYIRTGKSQGGATFEDGYRSIVLAEQALRSLQEQTEIKVEY